MTEVFHLTLVSSVVPLTQLLSMIPFSENGTSCDHMTLCLEALLQRRTPLCTEFRKFRKRQQEESGRWSCVWSVHGNKDESWGLRRIKRTGRTRIPTDANPHTPKCWTSCHLFYMLHVYTFLLSETFHLKIFSGWLGFQRFFQNFKIKYTSSPQTTQSATTLHNIHPSQHRWQEVPCEVPLSIPTNKESTSHMR